MLRAILLFVAADAFGEATRVLLHLPVSGAVLGMVLLFMLFVLRGSVPVEAERTGQNLLRLLPLFFVPLGVGITEHAALVMRYWPVILTAIAGSSIVALLVTGFALSVFNRKDKRTPDLSYAQEPTP